MIDVLVVEDHRPIYMAVAHLMQHIEDMRVVGRVNTADHVIPSVLQTEPDVVLMNLVMLRQRGEDTPAMCGLEVTQEITDNMPGVKVLIFSALDRPDLRQEAVDAGAAGYLRKDCTPEELIGAIRTVAAGGNLWNEVVNN